MAHAAIGTAAGFTIDLVLGEPPDRVHPLRAFGSGMATLESAIYAPSRARGALYAAVGITAGAAAGAALGSVALAVWLATGGRALEKAAQSVERCLATGDIAAGRRALRALVSRETDQLEVADICRAVVESVAENTNDAVVGPMLYGALLGAPGALAYRAANTMDAMVGYRSSRYSRFGWASARLDDVLGYVPARATAALVAVVRPWRAAHVLRCVRQQAPAHPSPNAGVAEAAFAGALGARLGGMNIYNGLAEQRAVMGEGPVPGVEDIGRAVLLSRHVGMAGAALLALGAFVRTAGRREARLHLGGLAR